MPQENTEQVIFGVLYNDWEAPTGGYLLTASMASGRVAGRGALQFLAQAAAA